MSQFMFPRTTYNAGLIPVIELVDTTNDRVAAFAAAGKTEAAVERFSTMLYLFNAVGVAVSTTIKPNR